MKNNLLILILFSALISCTKENEDPEFEYDHSVARSYYLDDVLHDSIIFYYDTDNKLLKSDKYYYGISLSEFFVTYSDNTIITRDGLYYLDGEQKVFKRTNLANTTEYSYSEGLLTKEISSFNTRVTEERFYFYEDLNLVTDSMVHYHNNDENSYITVYHSIYTDTLVPAFIPDWTGLYEIPGKSMYLPRQKESFEHSIKYIFRYEILENELTEYAEFWDTNYDTLNEVWKTKYVLKYK